MKIIERIAKGLSHLIKRLPYIAIYTFAALVVLLTFREIYRANAPGRWYFEYESYTVQNAPEGEHIPYKVCRNRTGTYTLNGGARSVFRIVNLANPNDQEIVASIPFPKGTTTTNRQCINGFVDIIQGRDVLDLPKGDYIVTHVVEFTVPSILPWIKPYEKKSEVQSNIFKITERSLSLEELINEINRVQQELDNLKKQLPPGTDLSQLRSTTQSSTNNQVSSTNSSTNSGGNVNNPTNNTTNNNTTNNRKSVLAPVGRVLEEAIQAPGKLIEGIGNLF